MKTIIKYIIINRTFLFIMALFCTLLMPMLDRPIQRGNAPLVSIYQGNHEYVYSEPKPMYQDMWSVWDSKWYISIADDGYSQQRYPYTKIDNKGFMPLYAILIWFVSTFMVFGHSNLAGFLISNVFLVLSFYMLRKFILSEEKLREKVNMDNAFIYLLFFPTSYFLSSVYPESLFLFLSILSLYLINKKKIAWACVTIGLAFLTKIFGLFLLIPLAFYLWKHKKDIHIKTFIGYLLLTALFPTMYLYYMYRISGDAFAYMNIQRLFFSHVWADPFTSFYREFVHHFSAQTLLHGTATIFGLLVIIAGRKLIRLEHFLYSLAYILFTPITGTVNGNARYMASMFFVPIILSIMIKKENTKLLYVYTLSFIQGLIFLWWVVGAGFTS